MDLVATVRKSGSRGGVNFSWDDVASSNHRENYLGHSLKAPVGRWQKGRDLNWYAKAEGGANEPGETDEQRAERERKEELRKVKEAEEDAMAKALGLPPPQRDTTGANAIEVGNQRQVAAEGQAPDGGEPAEGGSRREKPRRHRDDPERRERRRRRHRSRSRSQDEERHDRRHRRHHDHREDRHRDREAGERRPRRDRSRSREDRRNRREGERRHDGRSDERRDRRRRSHSPRDRR
ncbi:hypothetical protein N3K66_006838 [Trichothecium roseum]|uniref:Uncharacterized protein n=1 Tax=Trichothecium roseum TaxID=47278 RepID=A0ACC0UX46_9HYPO|nr:hypothetical protein N3K66_006838 [Trichothecium roseum]